MKNQFVQPKFKRSNSCFNQYMRQSLFLDESPSFQKRKISEQIPTGFYFQRINSFHKSQTLNTFSKKKIKKF